MKYFIKRGSKTHCVSLGASKAFDKVLHNGLFVKSSGFSIYVGKLFAGCIFNADDIAAVMGCNEW